MHKKTSAPLVPWPRHHYLSKPGGGGGGLGGVAYKDRARPPRPPVIIPSNTERLSRALFTNPCFSTPASPHQLGPSTNGPEEKFAVLRHASKPPPTGPKNRCCSRLRHASTIGAWAWPSMAPTRLGWLQLAYGGGGGIYHLNALNPTTVRGPPPPLTWDAPQFRQQFSDPRLWHDFSLNMSKTPCGFLSCKNGVGPEIPPVLTIEIHFSHAWH